MSSAQEPTQAILQEAARWFVLLASGEASDADRERWQQWRAADTRHEAGWQRTQTATALFGGMTQTQTNLSSTALERHASTNQRRRRTLGGLAGFFVAGLFGWQGWRYSDWSADYRTVIGQQQDVRLPDGSQLRLDTNSVIDIAFSDEERLVRLRRGRVLITTAPSNQINPPPFFVQTAQGRVQALGTRFSVQQNAESTDVAVLEARVAIRPEKQSDANTILSAGQAARFDRNGVIAEYEAKSADTAWAKGMLIADNMPLDAFITELARYHATPLRYVTEVRNLRISGTYPLADTDQVLTVLADNLPIRVQAIKESDPARGHLIVLKK